MEITPFLNRVFPEGISASNFVKLAQSWPIASSWAKRSCTLLMSHHIIKRSNCLGQRNWKSIWDFATIRNSWSRKPCRTPPTSGYSVPRRMYSVCKVCRKLKAYFSICSDCRSTLIWAHGMSGILPKRFIITGNAGDKNSMANPLSYGTTNGDNRRV